jgi:hypothetical protein
MTPGQAAAMTPADLTAAGQFLFGRAWQSALARALHATTNESLTADTMRLWLEGKRPVSAAAEGQIVAFMANKMIGRVEELRARMTPPPASFTLPLYRTDADLQRVTGEPWSAAFTGCSWAPWPSACASAASPRGSFLSTRTRISSGSASAKTCPPPAPSSERRPPAYGRKPPAPKGPPPKAPKMPRLSEFYPHR